MEFRVLGTGSATPQLQRNPSAFVVDIDNTLILIDCGEATQFRLLQYKVKSSRIKFVLISHLHGDHYFGLIGLISSFNLQKRAEALQIFGPKGLDEIITTQLKYSNSILNYPLEFIETSGSGLHDLYENDSFKISSFPLKHRIECTGFIIKKKSSKRKIIANKLPENFPISYFKMLKDGFDVYDELSQTTYSNEVYTTIGSSEKTFAYCSDTIFDETIVPFIKGADLLYHESTFTDELSERAKATYHSTAGQAATIASLAEVGQLIIGHFSSRYKILEPFLEESQAIFKKVRLAKEGENFIF